MKITSEQMEAALSCKTPEELVERAATAGVTVSLDKAAEFLEVNTMVDIEEEDLDIVAGGCGTIDGKYACPKCHGHNTEDLGNFMGVRSIKCYDCDKKYGWTELPN